MDEKELLRLLMVNGARVFFTSCIGDSPPATKALYEVLTHPRPGDLVLEITTRREDPARFGRLLRIVNDEGMPAPNGEYWYIETVDGEEQEWYNCRFIRVLESHIDPIEEAESRGLYSRPEYLR